MTVDKDMKIQIRRYWKPEEIEIDEKINEQEVKEKFLSILSQSIACRIDNFSTTSFDLSGGLDSSSIVSLSKHLYPTNDINTISMEFDTLSDCDEKEYIATMFRQYELKNTFVKVDELDYKDEYSLEYNYQMAPHWPILVTFTTGFPVAKKLKSLGMKRIITGQGGDQLMGTNPYCMYDYYKSFHLIQLFKELKAAKRPFRALKNYVLIPMLNKRTKDFIKVFLQILKNSKQKKNIQKKTFNELSEECSKEPLAFRHDVDALNSTMQSLFFDISNYHVVNKHYGIKFFHPFYDRKLMEFMLSLPSKFKYREGVTKVLLRKVLKDILPEKIRQRKDKTEFSAVIRQQIDAIDLDELLKDTHLAKLGLIEQSQVDKLKDDYRSGKMKTIVYFWKIINMEYWYRYNFVDQKETVKH